VPEQEYIDQAEDRGVCGYDEGQQRNDSRCEEGALPEETRGKP
jgi:hypothetical protein